MSEIPTLISLNEACRITSLSRTGIFKLRSQGRFPTAVPLGEKRIAFVRDEVADFVRERIQSREVEHA
jgi:prophage regulatory protein